MERVLKVAVFVAGVAFVLSALTGMLAGVGFTTALVRALLSALVFGSGGAAVSAVVARLLPELLESSAGSGDGKDPGIKAPDAGGSGGRLNIVVEGDDGDEGDQDEEQSFRDDDDLVEEVEERSVDDEDEVMRSVVAGGAGADDADDTEDADGDSADTDSATANLDGVNSDDGDDSIEEMPDIGGFAGSFVSPEAGDAGGGSEFDGSGGQSSSEKSDAGNDPATIAKALRTMMNRDA